ncbi:FMN-binding protein [Enterococcus saigonensis]|uniref:FMN-binding protein n=1 Tax=Enterococcus saigonensis TaxID=1805431 RepID=A0A679I9Y0_9ENTE|nr:pyridoxamine 5'-phosphate oxidase family protein [Enterococcus saigonensis]BCA86458.1 FMN-binding protein [Enterococcus saigonensis]
MLNEKLLEVLSHEGVVTIISSSQEAPGYHAVNTWNSYIHVIHDKLYIPAAGMHSTEMDIAKNDQILMTIGSKEVIGTVGPGAGFHIVGRAKFISEGSIYEQVKSDLPFLTRVLEITVKNVEQKI